MIEVSQEPEPFTIELTPAQLVEVIYTHTELPLWLANFAASRHDIQNSDADAAEAMIKNAWSEISRSVADSNLSLDEKIELTRQFVARLIDDMNQALEAPQHETVLEAMFKKIGKVSLLFKIDQPDTVKLGVAQNGQLAKPPKISQLDHAMWDSQLVTAITSDNLRVPGQTDQSFYKYMILKLVYENPWVQFKSALGATSIRPTVEPHKVNHSQEQPQPHTR